jgi:hypothetical protein
MTGLLLLVAAMNSSRNRESVVLASAILGALPWSLLLLSLDTAPGFGLRAALVVSAGICVNAALLWWGAAWLRDRLRGSR